MRKPSADLPDGLSPELKAQLERSAREAEVKNELFKLGVSRSQILELVERYPLERIERQLNWIPFRRARKPSSMIVASIKENYDQPSAALEQTATLEQTTTSNSSSDYRAESSSEGNDGF